MGILPYTSSTPWSKTCSPCSGAFFPKTLELIRLRPPEPLWIEGDSGLIEQVVTNLCVNSRDAMMPKGGRITIAIARVTLGKGAASANVDARPGVFVRLTVEDRAGDGCGDAPAHL